jgi:hypothetical protein
MGHGAGTRGEALDHAIRPLDPLPLQPDVGFVDQRSPCLAADELPASAPAQGGEEAHVGVAELLLRPREVLEAARPVAAVGGEGGLDGHRSRPGVQHLLARELARVAGSLAEEGRRIGRRAGGGQGGVRTEIDRLDAYDLEPQHQGSDERAPFAHEASVRDPGRALVRVDERVATHSIALRSAAFTALFGLLGFHARAARAEERSSIELAYLADGSCPDESAFRSYMEAVGVDASARAPTRFFTVLLQDDRRRRAAPASAGT